MKRNNLKNKIDKALKRIRLRTWIAIGIIGILGPIAIFRFIYTSVAQYGAGAADPVAHWKFDERADNTCSGGTNDACDSSSSGLDGAFSATPPQWQPPEQCVFGSCLFFFSGNDIRGVQVADNAALDVGSGSFTIQAWIKKGDTTSQDYILQKYIADATDGGFGLNMQDDGTLRFGIDDDGTSFPEDSALSTQAYDDNEWHFVVGVKNGTSNIQLYVDGVLVGSDSSIGATGSVDSDDPLYIGVRSDGTTQEWENGFIDDVKMYDYARSLEEILVDYNNGAASLGATNQRSLSDGLIGYWKMDESAANSCTGGTNDSCDSSGNGFDLAWQADATFSNTSKFGRALSLDGTGDDARVADNATLDLTTGITISTWVKANSLAAYHRIVAKMDGSESTGYMMDATSGGGGIRLRIDSTDCETAAGVITTSGWYHVAATYDQSTMRIFINGVESKSCARTGSISTNNQDLTIGNRSDNNSSWNGLIDEARIYNRALSPAEIKRLHEWAPGPVGYWDFNESSGLYTYDRSGNNLIGTLGYTIGSHARPVWDTGYYGNAMRFDDTDDVISVEDNDLLDFTGSFTISAWIHSNDLSDEHSTIVTKGLFGTERNYALLLNYDEVRMVWHDGTDWREFKTTSANLTTNTWHYITYVRDATTETIYINGSVAASQSIAYSMVATSHRLHLGGRGSGEPPQDVFDGRIDEIKIYNYARTPSQIIEDMNGGHPIGGSPIGSQLAYLKFNEMKGTTANDSVGSYDATFFNSPTWSASGKYDGAIRFTNNSNQLQHLAFADNAFDGMTEGSVSLWFKPDDSGDNFQPLFAVVEESATTNAYQIAYQRSDDTIQIWTSGCDSSLNIEGGATVPGSQTDWHHLVVTTDSSGHRIYIDGQQRTVSYSTGSSSRTCWFDDIDENTTVYSLGCDYWNGTTCLDSELYEGLMDEVKIYSVALTPSQVLIDYNAASSLRVSVGSDEADTVSSGMPAPLGYWPFNENTGTSSTANIAGSNLQGTLNSMTAGSWVPGKPGSALDFDGTADYVSIADHSSLDFNSGSTYTYSFWLKPDSMQEWSTVWGQMVNSNTYFLIYAHTSGSSPWTVTSGIAVGSYNGGNSISYRTSNNNVLSIGEWSHVTVTYDGSQSAANRIQIYVNGTNQTNTGSGGGDGGTATLSTANTWIGANQPFGEYYNGAIDEVKYYNTLLTPAQIAYDYNRGRPIAHWKMNDCTGTTINDSSGFGRSGTLALGASGQTSAGDCDTNASTAWYNGRNGKYDASLNFDGTDDRVEIPSPNLPTGDFTYAVWFYHDVNSSDYIFAAQDSAASGNEISLRRPASSEVRFDMDGTTSLCSGGQVINIGQWYHYTVTRQGSSITGYLNGVQDCTGTDGDVLNFGTCYMLIGADDDTGSCGGSPSSRNGHWEGLIDDFRIYNYALTQTQIRQVMNEGSAVRFGP